jgi:hypothetical protein
MSISFAAPSSGAVWSSAGLSAISGGSGNPVVFSVAAASGRVCRVSGTTVTYTASGRCVIDANQAGDGSYGVMRRPWATPPDGSRAWIPA